MNLKRRAELANNDSTRPLDSIKEVELERHQLALDTAKEQEKQAKEAEEIALQLATKQRVETLEKINQAVEIQKKKRNKMRIKPLALQVRRPWGR